MICEHCKKEYSDSVWAIHSLQCEGPKEEKQEAATVSDDQAIRDRARALKISGSHNKSIARLLKEIEEAEAL
jgi:hypothetical protein